jgi:protein translocase SecG subunit
MDILHKVLMGIAVLSGIGLITAVTLQTNKADSFSAAMGGGDSGRFRKGSKEEMLDRLTKLSAIVWIAACALNAMVWFQMKK